MSEGPGTLSAENIYCFLGVFLGCWVWGLNGLFFFFKKRLDIRIRLKQWRFPFHDSFLFFLSSSSWMAASASHFLISKIRKLRNLLSK